MSEVITYSFLREVGHVINSSQTRSVLVTGQIDDLFFGGDDYVPLMDYLVSKWSVVGRIVVTFGLDGFIRIPGGNSNESKLATAWAHLSKGVKWDGHAEFSKADQQKLGRGQDEFEKRIRDMARKGGLTEALQFLKQLTVISRLERHGMPLLKENLIILIEGADLLVPQAEIARLSDVDRKRIALLHDWFTDPGFMNGNDTVVLFSESGNGLHSKVSRLPQVVRIEVLAPNKEQRRHCIDHFSKVEYLDEEMGELASWTAGLSTHALIQLVRGVEHSGSKLTKDVVIGKVETYIQSQLGDDVVEFKKPEHRLTDVVGNTKLKKLIQDDVIPRFLSGDEDALSSLIVSGPIGAGKTFIFEAAAAEMDMPVLVLKQIRSKWFGETDVILERLRRVMLALDRALIFVDEADTMFADVAKESHSTEKRVTGAIQKMMSDKILQQHVRWLLMTARVHLLPSDMRRAGRGGNLIIPVFDPNENDRMGFVDWATRSSAEKNLVHDQLAELAKETGSYAAADYELLRSELAAKARGEKLSYEDVRKVIQDIIPADIAEMREYQTLQAKMNCTRLSLLGGEVENRANLEEKRKEWLKRIRQLEREGIR